MTKNKTDEQMKNEYAPKVKNFADERLTGENAKRIYDFLQPYHYDQGGWLLYDAAKGILKTDVYSEFPTEDNLHYFEELDGDGLLKWLEIAKFADKDYEQLPGGYEKLKSHTLDKESPEYKEYQNSVYPAAVRGIIDKLTEKQTYLLEGFWNRLSYIENILCKRFPVKDDVTDKTERELKALPDEAKNKSGGVEYSEYDVKAIIRDALYNAPMTDEIIQALFITDNVLDEVYNFLKEKGYGEFDEGAFEYLETAEHDYLAERVYDRVTLAYEDFLDELKKKTPEKIIDEAYKIILFSDIQTSLDPVTSNFDTEQLKALKSLADPLWSLYQEWQSRDDTRMDDITEAIRDAADKQAAENKENSYEIDPDPFGLGDQEDENEQEP